MTADKGAGVDLDGMTVAELRALSQAAEAKAREKVEAEKRAILDDARARLAELGLSLEAALQGPDRRDGKGKGQGPDPAKLPVKYRGPKGEEWTGRGKVPLWLSEAEKQGRKRAEFAV